MHNLNPLNPTAAELGIIDEIERKERIENMIRYFIDLQRDDVDIDDYLIQKRVLKHYGFTFDELTAEELAEISMGIEAAT